MELKIIISLSFSSIFKYITKWKLSLHESVKKEDGFAANLAWQAVEMESGLGSEYSPTRLHGAPRFAESNSGPQDASGQQPRLVWPARVWKEYNVM